MAPANQSDRFPSQQDFLNDCCRRKKWNVFASLYPNIINRKTACWTSTWCWLCIIRHGLCLFPHGLCSLDPRDGRLLCLLKWNIFRIVLHKRSLFPSQLAFIENENIFTLFHNTNCSYCLERTESENYPSPFGKREVWSQREPQTAANLYGRANHLGYPTFFGRRVSMGAIP